MTLWHHGETDAAANRDMANVKKTAGELLDRLTTDMPDTPIYLFQATRCTGAYRENGVPEVIKVLRDGGGELVVVLDLREVADARPNVITGMNTDVLEREHRWDKCHFNSKGRDAIVAQVLPEVVARLRP